MRSSFILKRKQAVGQYLGVRGRGFDVVDIVSAERFPTNVLAARYAAAASEDPSVPDFEVKPDLRPPLHSSTGACRVCGCTEHFACPEGCSWVEPDLCSECAQELVESANAARA